MTEYLVPYESAESEFEEKRSRFISHVFLVETEAEARARIDEMKKNYPDALKNRYNLGELSDDTLQIFEQIAMARGFKLKGNQPDYERTAKTVIDDFRKGKLGKIMLEKPKKITLSEN